MFFEETSPGSFVRNPKFRLKNNFWVPEQYKEIDVFGWKICERINSVIESMKKEKSSQNLFNKEKTALRNLIKKKTSNNH